MLSENDVLKYSLNTINRNTVKRHYSNWRKRNNLPDRCDNKECVFYENKLFWSHTELKPILDHIDGNKKNNTPQNLRYLCPNCNSQQPTQGGRNIGRIQNESNNGYQIKDKDQDSTHAKTFPETQNLSLSLSGQK